MFSSRQDRYFFSGDNVILSLALGKVPNYIFENKTHLTLAFEIHELPVSPSVGLFFVQLGIWPGQNSHQQ